MAHSKNVILAFGLERSGTTWLGKILDSHPDTIYRHEPDSLYRLNKIPLFMNKDRIAVNDSYIKNYIDKILEINSPTICAKMPIFRKSYFGVTKYYIIKWNAFLSKLAKHYLSYNIPIIKSANISILSKQILVWKSIESFSRLGFLSNSLPNSKTVYIIRHPCGFISSLLKGRSQGFMPCNDKSEIDIEFWKQRLTCDIAKKHDLNLAKIKAMTRVEELSWRWLIDNDQVLHDLDDSKRSLVVIYDELCEDPLAVTKRIFDFCELSWSEQTENFVNASTSIEDVKYFSVFKDPKIAANKWRQQLNEDDIFTIKGIIENSESGKLFLNRF